MNDDVLRAHDTRRKWRSNWTQTLKELTRDARQVALHEEWEKEPPVDAERPKHRGDCIDGPRPCPWVSCRHHLYLEANASGSITFNFPEALGPEELEETCSLDVADKGGVILDRVGDLINVTRERVRQIEAKALRGLSLVGFGGLR